MFVHLSRLLTLLILEWSLRASGAVIQLAPESVTWPSDLESFPVGWGVCSPRALLPQPRSRLFPGGFLLLLLG